MKVKEFIRKNIQTVISGGVIAALISVCAAAAMFFNEIAPGSVMI